MKSPAAALIWEIWRKNRWGFALLGVLFAACLGLSRHAVNRQVEVAHLLNRPVPPGRLSWGRVLAEPSKTASGMGNSDLANSIILPELHELRRLSAPRPVKFTLSNVANESAVPTGKPVGPVSTSSLVVYEGVLLPQDTFSWSDAGRLPSSRRGGRLPRPRRICLKLGNKVLFDGWVEPGADLSWSLYPPASPAGRRTVYMQIMLRRYFGGMLAHRPLWSWRNSVDIWPISQQLGSASAAAARWRQTGLAWSAVLFGFSVLAIFAIFSCSEAHPRVGFSGIPPRQFTLPVRTSWLVIGPIGLGSASLLAVYFAWSKLVLGPLLPAGVRMPDLYLPMLLLAGLTVFQAVIWGWASFPKTRVCLLVPVILGLIPLAGMGFGMQRTTDNAWPAWWAAWRPWLTALFAAAWLVGVVAAWLGVEWERQGAWASRRSWRSLTRWARHHWLSELDFGWPLPAQVWMEWRRNCRAPLFVWAVVVWFVLADASWVGGFNGQWFSAGIRNDALRLLNTLGLLGCVVVLGLNLARDASSKKLALSSFTATRPVRTGELVLGKVIAGLAAWFLAGLFLALSVAAVTLAAGGNTTGWPDSSTALCVLLAAALNLFIGTLPLNLAGRSPGLPWSLLPLLLVYGGLWQAAQWVEHHPIWLGSVSVVLAWAVLAKLGLTLWALRRAIRLRLVGWSFVGFMGAYFAVWVAATGLLVCIAWQYGWRTLAGPWCQFIFIPAAMLSVPLARIALSPLALAGNRHR